MAGDQRLVQELSRISGGIVAGADLQATLSGVVEGMRDATGAERCSIMLRTGGGSLRIRAACGLPEAVVERTRVPLGQGIAGAVAESGAARLLRDAASSPGASASSTVYAGASALCVPLRAQGEVLGVVNLSNKRSAAGEPAEFSEADLDTAVLLANQAALAIVAAEAEATRDEHGRLQAALSSLQEQVLSLESQAGALAVIQQVTDSLTAAGTLEEILEGVVQHTTRLLGARRGSLLLREPDSRLMRMHAAVGLPEKVVAKTRIEIGEGVAGRCAALGQPLLVRDIDDLRGQVPGAGERGAEYRNKSALCVPLTLHGEVLGVLNLNDRADGKELGPEDLFVAQIVANQAAVAIWNAQLRAQAVAAAEAHKALAVAREIQQSFVPRDVAADGLEIAARSVACAGAGGDYVDFWPRFGPDGEATGEWVLVMGDVSGHGVGAALVMATARAFLRGLLAQSRDLPALMARLNELLALDVRGGRFVTLFVGLLSPAEGRLRYASAGHDPPLHRRADGLVTELEATGPPLAVVSDAAFPSAEIRVGEGDWLVLTTDGAWELRDATGACFGRERLIRAID
ncbi:MAG: SpoIIE family protein phosphatase, partial [Myxococcales bacterium]|nr:SpoIIE family protein phosphatase [Myxococcales bacterium]